MRKGGWIQTATGKMFWPLDAQVEEVDIRDIGHALANVNRYNGQCPRPYSVAQHSVIVSLECDPKDAMWGLLHDASEAYIADLVSPVKRYLPGYVEVENNLMAVICQKFGLPPQMPESVKRADLTVLAAEARDFYPIKPADWNLPYPPVKRKIKPVGWRAAKNMFLKRYVQLLSSSNG